MTDKQIVIEAPGEAIRPWQKELREASDELIIRVFFAGFLMGAATGGITCWFLL